MAFGGLKGQTRPLSWLASHVAGEDGGYSGVEERTCGEREVSCGRIRSFQRVCASGLGWAGLRISGGGMLGREGQG